MLKPLVSVVVPTYNCGKYVAEALESALSQDHPSFEVVVVDDGSSDDTLQVLARFGDRIRVFQGPNRGPAAARNLAVRESRGEFLAFLDGDDLWLPGHLSTLVGHAQGQAGAKVVYGEWLVWHAEPSGSFSPLQRPAFPAIPEGDSEGSGWIYSKLLFDSMIHIIAAVIHRSVFDAVGGFDETLRTGSDYDFWLRVSRRFAVVKLRRPVAVYRQNVASVTYTVRRENNPYRVVKGALDSFGLRDAQGNQADRRAVSRRLADLAVSHGYRHFRRGDPRIASEWFGRAWRHDPRRLKLVAWFLAASAKRIAAVFVRSH
jgi:glycosyltransferase involved in cell wall biosynthesis